MTELLIVAADRSGQDYKIVEGYCRRQKGPLIENEDV